MTTFEMVYLAMAIGAASIFAITLAYYSSR